MEPKLQMFLRERDRATARQDWGVVRSLTADLRRWGVPDDATLTHPSGKPSRTARKAETAVVAEEPPRQAGRPKMPRCEHGQIAERCPECNPESLAS